VGCVASAQARRTLVPVSNPPDDPYVPQQLNNCFPWNTMSSRTTGAFQWLGDNTASSSPLTKMTQCVILWLQSWAVGWLWRARHPAISPAANCRSLPAHPQLPV